MTYQGYLVNGNGEPLAPLAPKNFDVVFRIYDAQNGGNSLWAEQQTVTIDKGSFSVLLGEGSQYNSEPHAALSSLFSAPDASDRFVEVTVKGLGANNADVPIAPRLRLLTSPYAFLARGVTPIGGIIMYTGSTIPSGWALCDGSNGTPDLRDRFIVGAGNAYASGAKGGSPTKVLSVDNIPPHNHSFTDNTFTPIANNIYNSIFGGSYVGGWTGNPFTIPGTTANTGGGKEFDILPPYYALAFIMRVQ
jgi:microcystin-dependent protein